LIPLRQPTSVLAGSSLLLALFCPAVVSAGSCPAVPDWKTFVSEMVSPDGRVIDWGTPDQRSTSEGQAYALLMALIASDRSAFDRILQWTENNLAHGDLRSRLPAWHWGRAQDGDWRVIDPNPASDADLWMAYTLIEASRFWKEPRYLELGRSLARLVLEKETQVMPRFGRILLPAPKGFVEPNGSVRVNPSYMPPQILRRLADLFPEDGWEELLDSSMRILLARPNGLQSDWLIIDPQGRPRLEDERGRIGSYAAIRVYLWAGMLSPDAPEGITLRRHLARAVPRLLRKDGILKAHDAVTSQARETLPTGLTATLLPLIRSLRLDTDLARLCLTLGNDPSVLVDGYYTRTLAWLSLAWMHGAFRFGTDGRLILSWSQDP